MFDSTQLFTTERQSDRLCEQKWPLQSSSSFQHPLKSQQIKKKRVQVAVTQSLPCRARCSTKWFKLNPNHCSPNKSCVFKKNQRYRSASFILGICLEVCDESIFMRPCLLLFRVAITHVCTPTASLVMRRVCVLSERPVLKRASAAVM